VSYNFRVKKVWLFKRGLRTLLGAVALGASGCVTELPPLANPDHVLGSLIVGRVVTVLTGETSRRYLPQVRFMELENQDIQKRFQVEINAPDQYFAIDGPSGMYKVTRVQISEGPFLSMANLDVEFVVGEAAVNHVGTWRFGVESPRYGRKVLVSSIADQEERERVRLFLKEQYPKFDERTMEETLPQPSQMETRLYEVMPYPRYPRYFRRHWW
jgi:hypothetical protein